MQFFLGQGLNNIDVVLFVFVLLLVLIALTTYFFYSFIYTKSKKDVSPYSGMPLRYAREITFANQNKVNQYLKNLSDFDNRPIDFNVAAFCRETGRIFPNCVTWTGAIKLDWGFIQKRYRGIFVSWGSLSEDKKKEIQSSHNFINHFQTEYSSTNPSPRLIDETFAFSKPGPLYVDLNTKILLGWVSIPDSELEVLIVQKPISYKLLNLPKK